MMEATRTYETSALNPRRLMIEAVALLKRRLIQQDYTALYPRRLMIEAVAPLKRRYTSTRIHGAISQKADDRGSSTSETWAYFNKTTLRYIPEG
jgi:hypothetical protein